MLASSHQGMKKQMRMISRSEYKLFLVAGARPNFMKIAPIIRELEALSDPQITQMAQIEYKLVHTGQHYDYEMSQAFFDDLEIPKPDYFLVAGSGSHAEQTSGIMVTFEKVCEQERPDLVVVVGDVNSTLACSVVAKKMGIEVAHVEAGLRSFDLSMPEEINRMVTDSISDYFFVTERAGVENLKKEGKPEERIFFVGHVMIDNLLYQLGKVNSNHFPFKRKELKGGLGKYIFMTLHRPSNVDRKATLEGIATVLNQIAREIPILFPVHPRTSKMLDRFGIELSKNIYQLPPLGFQESLYLWKDAKLIITDSGGLQEETTALKIPCLTLRENTERPVTVLEGTNQLVTVEGLEVEVSEILAGRRKRGQVPGLWDGRAAERIVGILQRISRRTADGGHGRQRAEVGKRKTVLAGPGPSKTKIDKK
jgi:UDP-N-acetylglucosamine 2-epimerase (non-hydrolysing)